MRSELRERSDSELEYQRRDHLVDTLNTINEWDIYNSQKSGDSNNKRCLESRLGGMVRLDSDQGCMESRRGPVAHKW